MYEASMERPPLGRRIAALFDRAERSYLLVLRGIILIVATLLLLYCIWLGLSSLYKMSRSPDSVVEESASVSADELTDAHSPAAEAAPIAPGSKPTSNPAYQQFYSDFARRYFALFQSKFAPYRQPDDKQLTKQEFDDSFLNTTARLDAIKSGDLSFEQDRDDLENLYAVMAQAADMPKTTGRLRRYQSARKVPVTTKAQRVRTSFERGWDSSSTSCSNWYESPIGCSVIRSVETPYIESVTTMQFPKGTESHTQIFKAFQDRYFSLLEERRQSNSAAAEKKRADIIASITDGRLSLVTAMEVFVAFLALMFFFLLIAIERHQRRISVTMQQERDMRSDDEPISASA